MDIFVEEECLSRLVRSVSKRFQEHRLLTLQQTDRKPSSHGLGLPLDFRVCLSSTSDGNWNWSVRARHLLLNKETTVSKLALWTRRRETDSLLSISGSSHGIVD